MTQARWLALAGVLGLLAVGLGAFGAHALAGRLDGRGRELWGLASQYLLVHAGCVLALGAHAAAGGVGMGFSGVLMAAGSLIFSGSLYALALGAPGWVGAIAPVGGVSVLLAWGALVGSLWRS